MIYRLQGGGSRESLRSFSAKWSVRMIEPSVPENEDSRLAYLRNLNVLDTNSEQRFDRITRLASSVFSAPIALVSLVDNNRQWFKSKVGLDACQTERNISFCGHAILQQDVFLVEDASLDIRFHDNPLVVSGPEIRFYAGAPLLSASGFVLGTLCIISPEPRTLSNTEKSQLKAFAELVVAELEREQMVNLVNELKHSRDEYKSLVTHIPGVTYRCSLHGMTELSFISEQVYELTGIRSSDLLDNASQKTFFDLILDDDKSSVLSRCKFALSNKMPWQINYRVRHADGSIRWVQDRGFSVTANDGTVLYGEGFMLDVTAEVFSVNVAQRQINALTLLSDIANWHDDDLDVLIQKVLSAATAHLGSDIALLAEKNATHPAKLIASVYWDKDKSSSTLEQSCLRYVNEHPISCFGEITVLAGQDSDLHNELLSSGIVALISIMLPDPSKVLVFVVIHESQVEYDHSDLIFIQLLAKWISGTITYRQEQRRINSLLSQSPGMLYQYQLFSDGNSCFPYSSAGIEQIYGLTAESVKYDCAEAFKRIHPADLAEVKRSITESASQLSKWSLRYRTLNPEGLERWLQGDAVPEKLDDGSVLWHGYIQDVTEQRIADIARLANQQLLESLFELSPVGIALNDLETGRFVHANQALLAPTGYELDEFLNLDYWQLTPKKYMRLEAKQRVALNQMGHYGPIEKEYIRKNGKTYPVMLRGVKVSDANGRPMIWSIVENITDRKNAEKLLYDAKVAAEQTALAKSMFLTNMSHEIRTPLNGILGMLDVLNSSIVAADQKEQVQIALTSGKNLLALIDDVLDFSQLDAGDLQPEVAPLVLLECIKGCVERYSEAAVAKGLHIGVEDTAVSVFEIETDKRRFIQIIENLLSNAIKFTSHGKINLILSAYQVEQDVEVVVKVIDSGIGMAPEQIQNVFSGFSQVDSSTTREYGGVGLGLAISRRLARLLNGDISVISELGKGSEFCFIFRAKSVPYSDIDVQPDSHLPSGLTLLLVEDSKVNQQVIKAMLDPENVELLFANDGMAAIDLLKNLPEAKQQKINLILMDCLMPKLDGYQTSQRLRRGDVGSFFQTLPIIAITANASVEDKQKCIDAGMNDVLTKPVNSQSLIRKILQILNIAPKHCNLIEKRSEYVNEPEYQPEETIPGASGQICVWDQDGLAKALGSMQGMLLQLVQLFLRQIEPQGSLLAHALEARDGNHLLHLSHTLKGGASQLYCKPLAAKASAVEEAAKNEDWEQLPVLVNSLIEILEQTRAELSNAK